MLGLEEVIDVRTQSAQHFGTAGPIANLFPEVWKDKFHVFAMEGLRQGDDTENHKLGHPDHTSSDTLNQHPVELLAIKVTATSHDKKEQYWARWLDGCQAQNLSMYVIVLAATIELVEESGLQSKVWRWQYSQWGYDSNF